ncbi:MAG: metalloregulator ArsR/SmtB family transcription factor [Bacteroidetes bacterium]|jgi:DNA-binding transcriptional ArsR family regulator|nr:metalloregulator ArsR/SmtB family transcription factor [Bacteroidota bacterium]
MTYTKSDVFDQELREIALIAKALSHPARVAILKYLAETKTCISGDISNEIPLSRTTVSQHLQELKKAGMIKGEIDGVKINYCLSSTAITKFKTLINKFFSDISCC